MLHIDDTQWLGEHSPLAAPLFQGGLAVPAARGLRLQRQLHETALSLGEDGGGYRPAELLRLTYLQRAPTKNQQGVALALELPIATYYRHKLRALQDLATALLLRLEPVHLRESAPGLPAICAASASMKRLVSDAEHELAHGRWVYISGGIGLGKSMALMVLAQRPNTLWHTHKEDPAALAYAIGAHLHDHGQPLFLAQLIADAPRVNLPVLTGILRSCVQVTPELRICVDQINAPLGETHLELLRALQPGQVALSGRVQAAGGATRLEVQPLDATESRAFAEQLGLALNSAQANRLQELGRGSPLFIRLFAASCRQGASFAEAERAAGALPTLSSHVLDALSPAAHKLLAQLAGLPVSMPQQLFDPAAVSELGRLGLITFHANESLSLTPGLSVAVNSRLPGPLADECQNMAAQLLLGLGLFTDALGPLIGSGQHERAVQTWYPQRTVQIKLGRGPAAYRLFAMLPPDALKDRDVRSAHALILAELARNLGRLDDASAALKQAEFEPGSAGRTRTLSLQGDVAVRAGKPESAIAFFERAIKSLDHSPEGERVRLHARVSRIHLHRLRNVDAARRESALARVHAHVLAGELEDQIGTLQDAHHHYEAALALVEPHGLAAEHALILQNLGIVEARVGNLERAATHLHRSGEHFAALGNTLCAIGSESNISYALLLAGSPEAALDKGKTALVEFERLRNSYWTAVSAANVAEACLRVGQIREAEMFAMRVIREEEASCMPYAQYVLGEVYALRGQFDDADAECQRALSLARQNGDRWALAPALMSLARICARASRGTAAAQARLEAATLYESIGAHVLAARARAEPD